MLVLLACYQEASLNKPGPTDSAGDSGIDSADTSADTGETAVSDSGDGDTGHTETGIDETGTIVDTGAIEIPPACTNWGVPVQTGLVADPTLDELSGLAPSYKNPGILWMIMDHGNPAEIYALDEFGALVATIVVDGVEAIDWEDIDLVPCDAGTCLVVADTGDNEHTRTDLALVVVEEPTLDGFTTDYTLPATKYGFTWPIGNENNESLTHTQDGRFVLVSKRTDVTAGVYSLPMFVDGAVAESHGQITTLGEPPQGEPAVPAPVTSAALWPDDGLLLVRTYLGTISFTLPTGIDGVDGVALTPVAAPPLEHDEAIAVDVVRDGYWTVPEAHPEEGSPIWFVPCVR